MPLFFPTRTFSHVREISPQYLRELGIKGVLLDVDNTLSFHGAPEPDIRALQWVKNIQRCGIKAAVVSNNSKERVAPFAAKLGLPFFSMAGKPFPLGYWRAAKSLGLPRARLLVVGDQIFTDILGANLAGMRSALVKPLKKEEKGFRFRRWMEKRIRGRYEKRYGGAERPRLKTKGR